MKTLLVSMILLLSTLWTVNANATFIIGCTHWTYLDPDEVYNFCEVSIYNEEIVANVDLVGIISEWSGDVYTPPSTPFQLGATWDDNDVDNYPGPFVSGTTVQVFEVSTEVASLVMFNNSPLIWDEYCWDSDFLYRESGTWHTYLTDADCAYHFGFN